MSAVAPRAAAAARRTSPKTAGATRERQMHQSEDRAATTTTADKVKKRLPSSTASTRGLPSMLLRRAELLRRSVGGGGSGNMQSLSVSCASEASNDSFRSRASTGRIGRPVGPPGGAARRRAAGSVGLPSARAVARKAASVVPDGAAAAAAVVVLGSLNGEAATAGPARCPWVTPNIELLSFYMFHGDEIPIIRGSALPALQGTNDEIGKNAILKLMDAVHEYIPDPVTP